MVIIYLLANIGFYTFSKVLYFKKVKGLENLPKGPYVLCCNHSSNNDVPVLTSSVPRFIRYIAKEELFGNPVGNAIFNGLEAIPLKRKNVDLVAVKRAIRHLKKGRVVGIFPEGSRGDGKTIKKAKTGSALIALRARVNIVPVGITGNYKKFKKIEVNIGEPIDLSEYYDAKITKEVLEKITDIVMERISKLSKKPCIK